MYLTNLLAFLLVLLYSGTQVNGAATTFVPTTGTAFAIGSDASIAATIDVAVSQTITVTYDLATPVSIGSIGVVHDEANAADKITVTATAALADRYTITKTDDTTVTVVIKAIAATDDAIVLQFNSDGGTEDGSTTIDTKTGFSPASQYVAFGDDLTVVATIPVDATQTFTVTYELSTPVTLGSITVVHDAATEAAKLVVAAESGLASKYSIAETTDTTVTIMIKTIANADDGTLIKLDSDGDVTHDVEYTVNAKTTFSPASLTTGTVGSDFVITVTMSVAANHVTSLAYFNGNIKTEVATLTVVATNGAASKLTVTANADLDATEFAIAKATDTTVTLTLKTYAEADSYSVFLFDSAVNNQDAVFVIGASPSGAASLTCGFSILLALAVALREFMSA